MERYVEVLFFDGAPVLPWTLPVAFQTFSICFSLSVIPKSEQYNLPGYLCWYMLSLLLYQFADGIVF